jgi:uncharacterized protein YcnI
MSMKKVFFVAAVAFFSSAVIVSAHVVVTPNKAGIGSFQTFTVSVPVEKQIGTIGVRLVIPEGLESVMPNVKPSWRIQTKKTGQGEGALVTEIIWSNGFIGAGQRDQFMFSAKTPSATTTLIWKAYQTYADLTVIAWDKTQEELGTSTTDFSKAGPYSVTTIINDLAPTTNVKKDSSLTFSLVALVLSIVAIGVSNRKRRS